ncbi:hypothetical protein OEA41_008604 [Lepraria neglecta]|uniref:Uncharacterized protein n=1 Tax=Lepraria neglecta TaxID=209136 RepID=A0AAD9Z1T1_9LECA|nr:hypothetical protein OEA41_008604 [Lepraria neglecta]
MYGEMGAWPAQQHTKAQNAAPLQDISGSSPKVKAMAATKLKRKKPTNGQKPKETEEEDDNKGTTDLIDGSLDSYDPEAKKWLPAVIHDDIHGELIDEAQSAYPSHQYARPDPSSGRPYDETAFKIEHEPWGPDRKDRPDIYFQLEADERQPHRPHPGFMKHDEKCAGERKTSPEKRAEIKKKMEARWEREDGKLQLRMAEEARIAKRKKGEEDPEDDTEEIRPTKRTRRVLERDAKKLARPKVNLLQQLKADKKKSGRRAAGAIPQVKKSKSLLRQDVAKNASQHREKADEAPVFDTDSDDEHVPLIVRKRQQRKPVAPIFGTGSDDEYVPVLKTKRQRAIPTARTFSSDSKDEDAPIKVTKRKRPAVPVVESDSDDEAEFVPRGGRRHPGAAPDIESESDSDPDPFVLQQLRRVNKRVRDDLAGYLAGDDTLLAKRQRVSQDQNAYPVGGTNEYQRKAKRSRHLSQSRPQQRQHSQTSQELLGDVLANRVAKVVASITPADLNPLQTASTSERYYDQVAEALQPTREAHFDLTRYEAPSTNRWDSYATQWQRIYNSFKFNGGMITDGKIPDLVRLSPQSSLHPLLREWCGARFD